jgi:hypothetical protein
VPSLRNRERWVTGRNRSISAIVEELRALQEPLVAIGAAMPPLMIDPSGELDIGARKLAHGLLSVMRTSGSASCRTRHLDVRFGWQNLRRLQGNLQALASQPAWFPQAAESEAFFPLIQDARVADEHLVHKHATLSLPSSEDRRSDSRREADASQNVPCDEAREHAGAPAVAGFAPGSGLDYRMQLRFQKSERSLQRRGRFSENRKLIDGPIARS